MALQKDLLGLSNLPAGEIEALLNSAAELKRDILQKDKKSDIFCGRTVVCLFYENSTRTRVSFELAAKYLGAHVVNVSAAASSVSKGETLLDTARNLEAASADMIIMRHPYSGAPHLLSKQTSLSVVNAGDGMNEHPTQALLDMLTMKERLGGFHGRKIAIIGDILHSRVARSNMWGLCKLGAKVYAAGPATLLPFGMDIPGVTITTDLKEALKDADVVMSLRLQLERQKGGLLPSVREYSRMYGINKDVLSFAKPGALVMHPGPINRGFELSSPAADGNQSVILEQVTNGVAVRMAVIKACLH